LRERGWKADLLNWDGNPLSQIFYHGEDFRFVGKPDEVLQSLRFYVGALYGYDVFHFANAHGIGFGWGLGALLAPLLGEHGEIHLLKQLGKKIAYTNNGCLDGVSQTAFSKWGPESVCSICRWKDEPTVCSDERNLRWGRFRNSVADYQCLLGGNRVDYNDDPRVHEDPWVYCLDPEVWHPDLQVPQEFRIGRRSERTMLLYHAVGNRETRTRQDGVNIKSSHVYLPLIDKLRGSGWDIELIEPVGVPNKDVRFLQLQADIFLDMLSFGWFGANAREAMMLGKPVICFLRPEWLQSLREELPEYAEELPIVSATPETIEEVLVDLMSDAGKRAEVGRRSREFMLKWHSAPAAAAHFDSVYARLLAGDPLLRPVRPTVGVQEIPLRRRSR
jgi:glycosyltransferase involved in cell wall biosynthesis